MKKIKDSAMFIVMVFILGRMAFPKIFFNTAIDIITILLGLVYFYINWLIKKQAKDNEKPV
jgi:positive regulator of sigma E activity